MKHAYLRRRESCTNSPSLKQQRLYRLRMQNLMYLLIDTERFWGCSLPTLSSHFRQGMSCLQQHVALENSFQQSFLHVCALERQACWGRRPPRRRRTKAVSEQASKRLQTTLGWKSLPKQVFLSQASHINNRCCKPTFSHYIICLKGLMLAVPKQDNKQFWLSSTFSTAGFSW